MSSIKDKLEAVIDLEEIGRKIDPGKLKDIKDRIDLRELGSRLDLDRLTTVLERRKAKKATNAVLFILALIGAAALAAGIAYLIHRYLTPAYTDDFDDDFEDFEEGDDDV